MRAAAHQIGSDGDRLVALVAEHRHAQAAHRGALAGEIPRAVARTSNRIAALVGAIEAADRPELAQALADESRTGAALLVALTIDDATANEVDQALRDYQRARLRVDHHTAHS